MKQITVTLNYVRKYDSRDRMPRMWMEEDEISIGYITRRIEEELENIDETQDVKIKIEIEVNQ